MKIEVNHWRALCEKIFNNVGVSDIDAKTIVNAAITADLRGVSSHGTVRLSTYRKRITMGLINKNPDIKITNTSKTFLHIDGDNGMGQVVASYGVKEGIKRAKEYGCCCVSIRNTNHMGMLSYYALKAAEEDMIAFVTSNTPPFVAAIGGAEPAVGTNPICWAIPSETFPVVLDMAISPARGKIKNAAIKGESIPQGWALDKNGNPTTDAMAALEGVLLPVGGVKGYGLGVIVEMLTGILSGGKYGDYMTHPLDDYENTPDIGNFLMLLDLEQIMPITKFKQRMSDYVNMMKKGKKSKGVSEIYLPGEIEYNNMIKTLTDGIEIDDNVYNEIRELAKE